VRLQGQYFEVMVPDPGERDRVRRVMEQWYLAHARETFTWRMEDLISRIEACMPDWERWRRRLDQVEV
jgi:hypothetical protein